MRQVAPARDRAPRRGRNRFTEADRDRIRRGLLRYMDGRRIGVPTLLKEIAAANDLSPDRIPQKTLQRFLQGLHRTNDPLVRFCAVFLEGAAESDPVEELGAQLTAYFGLKRDEAGRHMLQGVPDYAIGAFTGFAPVAAPGMKIIAGEDHRRTVYSTLTVEARRHTRYAVAAEKVTNWRREAAPDGKGVARPYEGIALETNDCLFVLMRNLLSGAPRLYMLFGSRRFDLQGDGIEAVTALDDSETLRRAASSYSRVDVGFRMQRD